MIWNLWPHRRLAYGCPGFSTEGMGQWWLVARLGAWIAAVPAWDLLREVTIIFITSTIVWPQISSREGTQLHSSKENWLKDLLSMAQPMRTRPSIPLSQSIPSEAFISLCEGLWSRAKANSVLPRECAGHSKHHLPTTWLYTWKSSDGQHWYQTDYILCSQRWRSSIQSAKTRLEADCGSDHELLLPKSDLRK